MAAHPQREQEPAAPENVLAKNPFPSQMTVPGVDGDTTVVVDLAVVDGTVYAPMLEQLPVSAAVRQYVTEFCAAWSMSNVTTARLTPSPAERPRRAQVVFDESSFHMMLGLAPDEKLVRIDVDQVSGRVRFIVESPRLPQQPYWNGGPPIVTLPIAAHYEPQVQA